MGHGAHIGAFGGAGHLLDLNRMMRRFLIAVLLIALIYGISFVVFVSTLPRAPESAPRADAVVALTGGDTRLEAAADLLRHGRAKRMLISGVDEETSRRTLKTVMHGGATFDCCVDIGYDARDTRDNAVEAANWVREHGFKSILLVTGRYHMPRARTEFQDAMPGIAVIPYPVEENGIELSDWWHHRATTLLLAREYAKYLAALARTSIT